MPTTDAAPRPLVPAAAPPSNAARLGVLQYRLSLLLVHLAVRSYTGAALADLTVLREQLHELARSTDCQLTSTVAGALVFQLDLLRDELAFAASMGPAHLTSWEARR